VLVPPQSLHLFLRLLCWQMPVPPQSLQVLLTRLCAQMLPPPQCTHLLRWRQCGHFLLTAVLMLIYDASYQKKNPIPGPLVSAASIGGSFTISRYAVLVSSAATTGRSASDHSS
jgi:hypothetical protein